LTTSTLGPFVAALIITPDLSRSIRAYCDHLHQQPNSSDHLTLKQARQWNLLELCGANMIWLANDLGERWLGLIEDKSAEVVDPFHHKGWMSLEINVQDVDALRLALQDSPFKIIGEPANQDVSDEIRAMQVIGPAGEVLNLTELKTQVPPSELPHARCAVDRLSGLVMLTDDRDRALSFYEQFNDTVGLKSDTKITIQLKEECRIEIDQLDELSDRPSGQCGLPAGIAMITVFAESIPSGIEQHQVSRGGGADLGGALFRGEAGELLEVVVGKTTE
jgi:hypothetical protein